MGKHEPVQVHTSLECSNPKMDVFWLLVFMEAQNDKKHLQMNDIEHDHPLLDAKLLLPELDDIDHLNPEETVVN